jgi:spore germination protein KB
MIEKGRISSLQMSLLIYANMITTAVLTVPGITFQYAKRDLWLSPIWGSLSGFLVVFIVYQLNKLYPRETPVQYMQHILGRFFGKVVGLVFLFYYLYVCGITLRLYGDFLVGTFFRHTPILIVMGCLSLASSFAVRAGLEVLARLSDMFVPILFLLWLLIVLLLIPELEVKKMFPILEDGIMPSIRGSVPVMSWNALVFYIATLLPFLRDRKKAKKWGIYSVLAVMLTLVMTNFAILFLFGNITGNFVYPVMSASRYISYADFFENLESIVMAIWIGGTFIKLGVMQYVLVLNTAQWLNLSDYKPIAMPFALLMILFGFWISPNISELSHFLDVTIPFLTLTLWIIIPAILLMIALLRKEST